MQNKIDFTVMGLDHTACNFLNWCMEHRNNLEYQMECKVQDLKSASATLFFDDFGNVARIDRQLVDRRVINHIIGIFDKPVG